MNPEDHQLISDGDRARRLMESGDWAWFVREAVAQMDAYRERLVRGGSEGAESDDEIRARYRMLEEILTWPLHAAEQGEATRMELELERA